MLTRRTLLQTAPLLAVPAPALATSAQTMPAGPAGWDELADGRDPIYRDDSFRVEMRPHWLPLSEGLYKIDTSREPTTCTAFACWKPVEDHPWLMGEVAHWNVKSKTLIEYRNLSRRARLECADHWAFREAFGCWPYEAAKHRIPYSELVWVLGERLGDGRSVTSGGNWFTKPPTSRADWIQGLRESPFRQTTNFETTKDGTLRPVNW